MRATLDLPDLLVRQMQQRASREGRHVDELAADLLRTALSGSPVSPAGDGLATSPKSSSIWLEGDRFRANLDVDREGYKVRRGMEGTIVAVYRGGEAFAIELPGLEDPAGVVTMRPNELGRIEDGRYTVDCNCPTPAGQNPCIRTVWQTEPEDPRPRLITAHPLT